MRTFITQRALAASPMIMGGDLPTIDDYSLALLTNKDMLACNQNGHTGTLIKENDSLEIWGTCVPGIQIKGWIGFFNRSTESKKIGLTKKELEFVTYYGHSEMEKIISSDFKIKDIWNNKEYILGGNEISVVIESGDVLFLFYEELSK
jgi:hypothetical protein